MLSYKSAVAAMVTAVALASCGETTHTVEYWAADEHQAEFDAMSLKCYDKIVKNHEQPTPNCINLTEAAELKAIRAYEGKENYKKLQEKLKQCNQAILSLDCSAAQKARQRNIRNGVTPP